MSGASRRGAASGGSSAAGLCLIIACLIIACQAVADFERSPAASGPDAGSATQAEGNLRGGEGGAPSSPSSSADAGYPEPAPDADAPERDAATPERDAEPTPTLEPASSMGPVGSACVEDGDCAQVQPFPLICITSQSNEFPGITPVASTQQPLGGPAGGYCSRACGADGECGAGARCVDHAGFGAFCYAVCSLTEATAQCVGGGPQACATVNDATNGACYPMCRSHEECGPERSCDASSGLCVAQVQASGGGVGEPCSVDTEATDCQSGLCLYELATGDGICTALCRGGDTNCAAAAGEPALGSVCLSYDPSPGAVGWCAPLCDTDADCVSGASVCRLGSPVAGRQGVCDLPTPP